jgi:6-pyruvoyltetrahydropterin/6-carboxytetrahydropterin synthase
VYEIEVEGRFSAVHRHPEGPDAPGGPDAPRRHGHDFRVIARVRGEALRDDVLVDFHAVETELGRILADLDHTDLGERTPAALARSIHDRLKPAVPGLAAVEVRDTERSGARYQP